MEFGAWAPGCLSFPLLVYLAFSLLAMNKVETMRPDNAVSLADVRPMKVSIAPDPELGQYLMWGTDAEGDSVYRHTVGHLEYTTMQVKHAVRALLPAMVAIYNKLSFSEYRHSREVLLAADVPTFQRTARDEGTGCVFFLQLCYNRCSGTAFYFFCACFLWAWEACLCCFSRTARKEAEESSEESGDDQTGLLSQVEIGNLEAMRGQLRH